MWGEFRGSNPLLGTTADTVRCVTSQPVALRCEHAATSRARRQIVAARDVFAHREGMIDPDVNGVILLIRALNEKLVVLIEVLFFQCSSVSLSR